MNDTRRLLAEMHAETGAARDSARAGWKDVVADDFERRYWTGIDQAAREFLAACEAFEDVLERAENAVRRLD